MNKNKDVDFEEEKAENTTMAKNASVEEEMRVNEIKRRMQGVPVFCSSKEDFLECCEKEFTQTTEQKLQEIADRLYGDEKIDWGNLGRWKYYIGYNGNSLFQNWTTSSRHQGVIYSEDSRLLKTAIKEIGEDVLKRDLFGIETPEKEYTMAEAIKEGLGFWHEDIRYNLIKDELHRNGSQYNMGTVWILEHQNEIVTIIGAKNDKK